MKLLFVAFYLACLFLGANSDQQLNSEDNSSVHGQVITPEEGPVAYNGTFEKLLEILWKNFEQKLMRALDSVPKNKPATSADELLPSVSTPSEATDLEKNGEADDEILASRKFNPRSLVTLQAKEGRSFRDSGSSSKDSDENGHRYRRQVGDDTSSSNGREVGPNFPNLFNLPEFLLKTAHLDTFGLPGQPIRKIIEFLREMMKQKQEGSKDGQPLDRPLVNKLLEGGADLLGKLIL